MISRVGEKNIGASRPCPALWCCTPCGLRNRIGDRYCNGAKTASRCLLSMAPSQWRAHGTVVGNRSSAGEPPSSRPEAWRRRPQRSQPTSRDSLRRSRASGVRYLRGRITIAASGRRVVAVARLEREEPLPPTAGVTGLFQAGRRAQTTKGWDCHWPEPRPTPVATSRRPVSLLRTKIRYPDVAPSTIRSLPCRPTHSPS